MDSDDQGFIHIKRPFQATSIFMGGAFLYNWDVLIDNAKVGKVGHGGKGLFRVQESTKKSGGLFPKAGSVMFP